MSLFVCDIEVEDEFDEDIEEFEFLRSMERECAGHCLCPSLWIFKFCKVIVETLSLTFSVFVPWKELSELSDVVVVVVVVVVVGGFSLFTVALVSFPLANLFSYEFLDLYVNSALILAALNPVVGGSFKS